MDNSEDSPGRSIDDLAPDEVDIETIDAFHLGGTHYAASFELSDQDSEFARSFLLEVDFGATLTYDVRLRIENSILSHASLGDGRHVVLELGKRMHDLTPAGDSMTVLPDRGARRIWHLDAQHQYAFGDRGTAYAREGGAWERIGAHDRTVFRDMHGPSSDKVHACGNLGALMRLAGREWVPIELAIQQDLHAIEVSADGAIHVGGADGAAYAIIDDELIALESQPWDYFGVRSFKGQRYWTDANYGISVQRGNSIVPFRELGQGFYMHASPEKLVISGWKEVFIFDGENWDGFELGYDGNIFLRRLDMADYGG